MAFSRLQIARYERLNAIYQVRLTGNVTANLKGSWVEIIASTAFGSSALCFGKTLSSGNVQFLVDIGIGGSGSEQVIVPNIMTANGDVGRIAPVFQVLPMPIPAGTRIACRIQANGSSKVLDVVLATIGSSFSELPIFSRATAYGDDTSDSGGTQIDPGGSANTKGSWSQLTASTTNPIRWLWIMVSLKANSVPATASFSFDIGIGAGGSEQIIIPDITLNSHDATDTLVPGTILLPVSIPSGTRLAARAQSTTTDATDRLFDLSCIGFN